MHIPTIFTVLGGWATSTLLLILLFSGTLSWLCYRRIFQGVPETAHERLQLLLGLVLIVTAMASWQGAIADTTPRIRADKVVFVVGYMAGAPVVSTAFVLFLRTTLLSDDELAQLQTYRAERRHSRCDRFWGLLAGFGRKITGQRVQAHTGKTRPLNKGE